jgi:hypothetical protein
MWVWLKSQYARWLRRCEADRRGWGSVGKMFANGRTWTGERWGREIRRSNRLYRIAHGKNPWRPFNGF